MLIRFSVSIWKHTPTPSSVLPGCHSDALLTYQWCTISNDSMHDHSIYMYYLVTTRPRLANKEASFSVRLHICSVMWTLSRRSHTIFPRNKPGLELFPGHNKGASLSVLLCIYPVMWTLSRRLHMHSFTQRSCVYMMVSSLLEWIVSIEPNP